MGWTTPRTWTDGEIVTKAIMDQYVRDNQTFLKKNTAFEAAAELTISGGIVTKTQAYHKIDTESDASSDDLDTISGGAEGEVIILRADNTARTVVVKNGTGNIIMNSDVSLNDIQKHLMLISDGTNWYAFELPVVSGSTYGCYDRAHYSRNIYA